MVVVGDIEIKSIMYSIYRTRGTRLCIT